MNDTATGNVASAFTANTLQGLALVYTASANSNAQFSVASANAWTNAVGVASNTWANTLAFSTGISATAWANTVGAAGNSYTNAVGTAGNNYATVTFAPKLSPSINNPTLTGTATINANIANQILTDGATINWDVSLGSVATVTLGGNRTVANPTQPTVGQSGVIYLVQDSTGSRTLSWANTWKFQGNTAPTLSTSANSVDMLVYAVRTTANIACQLVTNIG